MAVGCGRITATRKSSNAFVSFLFADGSGVDDDKPVSEDLSSGLGCKKKADTLRRLPFEKRLASLKVELKGKHEVPRILTAGDVAERGSSWSKEHIRRGQVGMVECIQEIGTKLQAH
jgi:hypothetical protein